MRHRQVDGLLMLARYCFEVRNMHRLTPPRGLRRQPDRVLTRAGFQHEGTLASIRWMAPWTSGVRPVEQEWPVTVITAAARPEGVTWSRPAGEKEEPEAGRNDPRRERKGCCR